MTSRKVLVDVLRAAGVGDDDAIQFAGMTPPAGVSWTTEVLNSGKVDETKFAAELARHFHTPCESVDAVKVDRTVLQLMPSRFVFKHHVLPLTQTETSVKLATYDGSTGVGNGSTTGGAATVGAAGVSAGTGVGLTGAGLRGLPGLGFLGLLGPAATSSQGSPASDGTAPVHKAHNNTNPPAVIGFGRWYRSGPQGVNNPHEGWWMRAQPN